MRGRRVAALMAGLIVSCAVPAGARSHPEGHAGVPVMVRRALPAIVSNTAKPVLRELIAKGRVFRPSLGVGAVSLTPQVAYANDLPIERGALVVRLEEGSSAKRAGFEAGDVITSVDGRPVRDLHDLHDLLFRRRAGDAVDVTLWRQGQVLTLRPVLQDDP